MDLIKVAEEAFATGKEFPKFKAGDTITVAYNIVEGSKERTQLYRGVVIKISGHGNKKRFTVRKMSGTVGVKIDYVGDTVFAKANNTSNTLSFIHTFEVEDVLETSVSVSGDIHLDVGIKGKKVTTAVDSRIRGEIGRKTKKTTTETLKTTIIIPANTKVTVTIKGKARLNNGVAKYFFLGIGTKKGTWEYIDIINEYYDYYEEAI